jgi:hypothetical protein
MKEFAASTGYLYGSTFQQTPVERASLRLQSPIASANPAESVGNTFAGRRLKETKLDLQARLSYCYMSKLGAHLDFFVAIGLNLVTELRKEFRDPIELPSEEVNHCCLVGQLQPSLFLAVGLLNRLNQDSMQETGVELTDLPACDVLLEGILQSE